MEVVGFDLKEKPKFREIKSQSTFLRSLWSQLSSLEIQDGLICQKVTGDETFQKIVPLVLYERRHILKECHDKRVAGHLSISESYPACTRSYMMIHVYIFFDYLLRIKVIFSLISCMLFIKSTFALQHLDFKYERPMGHIAHLRNQFI